MIISIIAVVIFLSVFILVHELGHFLTAKKFGLFVEEFGFGLPPRIWGRKKGETIYSINALPIGGFVKIFGEDREEGADVFVEKSLEIKSDLNGGEELKEEIKISSNQNRNFSFLPIYKRAIIIFAGVFMNFILGWLIISAVFMIGIPQAVLITEISPNSPAAQAGILAGDKILDFNSVNEFIKFIDGNRGKETVIKIERLGETLETKVVPRVNPPAGQGALGIGLVEGGLPKNNFFVSLWEGFKASLEIMKFVFLTLINLISKVFVGEASLDNVAGPVGVVKMTAQASSLGFIYILQFLALISLNLVVINLFPFPALDGGRLFFLLIEKIKGSPLPIKFERYTNAAGMVLLLTLMVVITIKDIVRLF